MTDFTIILRSMTTRMFSTVTTIITVAVAVALMLVLLSMKESGRQAFERGAGNMHMLVSAEASPLLAVLNSVFYSAPPRQALTWEKYRSIAGSFPWEFAIPIQQGDSYRGFPVMATTRDFFTRFQPHEGTPWQVSQGRFFEDSFEVVVGATAARVTGVTIGSELFLTHGMEQSRQRSWLVGGPPDPNAPAPHVHYEYNYKVVGILEPTGSAHDRALFTDLTSSWIIHAHDRRREANPGVPLATEADLIDADRLITGIYLRVATRPGRQLSAAQQQIYDTLRTDISITVADPHFEVGKLFNIVSNIDQVFIAIAGVVLVSSGIAIMLALYNSMEQRRRQIAVLRVLGASRMRVFGLVLTESAILGLLGALAGVALCFIGVQIVAELMKQRLGVVVSPSLEPVWTFVLVMATILLAALAGAAPAARAYQTAVIKHLKPLG
ncbi:MAG TPA: ABC transporter permease [Phycisphaerales bacterium]|nr:ABC transporter permease [Phycisphaerales bacterium]